MDSSFEGRKRTAGWLIPFAVVFLAVSILLPLSPIYRPVPSDDPSVYLYVGQRILENSVPYRDAWDHKQPLAYFLFALGLVISPHALWGIWLIEVVLLSAAAIFGLRLMERLGPRPTAVVSVGLALLGLVPILWGYSLEELALPLQIITLFALARILTARPHSRQAGWYVLIGILTALCFFLKQSLVAAGISVGFYLVVRMFILREWRILRGLAAAAAGFAAVTAVVLIYLAANGALPAYRAAAFVFNLDYANLGPLERLKALLDALESTASYPALFITFALWIACSLTAVLQAGPAITQWVKRPRASLWMITAGAALVVFSLAGEIKTMHPGLGLGQWFLILVGGLMLISGLILSSAPYRDRICAWLAAAPLMPGQNDGLRMAFIQLAAIYFPITLLLMTLSGRNYVYYDIALMPVEMLVLGLGAGLLVQRKTARTNGSGWVVLIATALALAYNPILLLFSQYASERSPALPEVAAYIQENTRPDETILVWGKDTTFVYFLAKRKAPTRFFYQAAVALDAYNQQFGAASELLGDLRSHPPALFLIPGEPVKAGTCPLPASSELNSPGPVFALICERYTYTEQVSGFQVYRLRP